VKVWYYRDNREAKLTTAMDKARKCLRAVAAELKRETDRSTAVEGRKRRVVVVSWRRGGLRGIATRDKGGAIGRSSHGKRPLSSTCLKCRAGFR